MSPATLADVVSVLHGPGEHIAVCTKMPGGRFVPVIMRVDEVMNMKLPQDCDVWFSVCPMREGLPRGAKGRAEDVTRWVALYADLDVKEGGLPSLDAGYAVIDLLSAMLGTPPAFVIESGHGLQPVWLLDAGDPATDT